MDASVTVDADQHEVLGHIVAALRSEDAVMHLGALPCFAHLAGLPDPLQAEAPKRGQVRHAGGWPWVLHN